MTLKQTSFELALLLSHGVLFEVFNARATHSFLDPNENFAKLKSDTKSLFWHVLRKYFATSYIFNGSARTNSAW